MKNAPHRGKQRAGASGDLTKTTITLPNHLIQQIDHLVYHYKGTERNFNRSALIQRIIEHYLNPTAKENES